MALRRKSGKRYSSYYRFPVRWTMAAIVLILVVFIVQALNLYKRSVQSTRMVFHTNAVLEQAANLDAMLRSMVAANRGYILTGNDTFLHEYNLAIDSARSCLTSLSRLTEHYPQQQMLQGLEGLVEEKIALNRRLIEDAKPGIRVVPFPSELMTVDGAIGHQLAVFQEQARALLRQQTMTNEAHSRGRLIYTLSSVSLAIIFLAASLFRMHRHVKRREEAEALTGATERKYMALVEDSGVATMIVNDKLQIRFVSKPIEDISGFTIEELQGKPFIDYIAPDYREQIFSIINDIQQTGDFRKNHEIKILTKSGKRKWTSSRMFPHATEDEGTREWQIILWDIDEEKKIRMELEQLEAEAREQQKLVQDIIDNIPMIVFIKDLKGRYRIINRKMSDMLGKPIAEVIGKTDAQLSLEPSHLEKYLDTDKQVLMRKETVSIEDVFGHNEHKRYFWVTKLPLLNESGDVKYICGVASDVTAFKEVEHNLIKAKEEAEQAKSAQEAFLANMSHEIRTPMNGIIGMTNLLNETSLTKLQQEYAESIQESAHSLVKLINDLLDISKIKSGKFQLESIEFPLRQVIRKVIYPLQFKASEKGIELEARFSDDLPEVLVGDPLRLQQVIINLANNAIKFTSRGSVRILLSAVSRGEDELTLKVDVEDTGIGIPTDKIKDIFDVYTQSSDSTARLYGGTGLGLSIVKQLVDLQGGQIKVESTLGKGSVFSVELPYKTGVLKLQHTEEEKQGQYAQILSGLRILVAEDNLINQKVVLFTLEKHGAKVTIVSNGQDAIDVLKKNEQFDLILMDIQMPIMDGYEATRFIRTNLRLTVPIIAMTANALKGEAERCYEAGASGYISKPFDQTVLYNMIAGLIQKNEINEDGMQEQPNNEELVDFSFLAELAEGRKDYMHQVLSIFMENTPPGLVELERLIRETDDWDAIHKKAHFLKSSAGIVRVRNMHEQLQQIEKLAREKTGRPEIEKLIAEITATFAQAEAIIKEKLAATADD